MVGAIGATSGYNYGNYSNYGSSQGISASGRDGGEQDAMAGRIGGAHGDKAGRAYGADGVYWERGSGDGSVKKVGERCQTCAERKYQDGSDDPSVSFQTPTRIDPDTAAATVRGHEMEHVFHEQSKAEREDRKVVSQSVTLHTDICPECGKVYVSGGTTDRKSVV